MLSHRGRYKRKGAEKRRSISSLSTPILAHGAPFMSIVVRTQETKDWAAKRPRRGTEATARAAVPSPKYEVWIGRFRNPSLAGCASAARPPHPPRPGRSWPGCSRPHWQPGTSIGPMGTDDTREASSNPGRAVSITSNSYSTNFQATHAHGQSERKHGLLETERAESRLEPPVRVPVRFANPPQGGSALGQEHPPWPRPCSADAKTILGVFWTKEESRSSCLNPKPSSLRWIAGGGKKMAPRGPWKTDIFRGAKNTKRTPKRNVENVIQCRS